MIHEYLSSLAAKKNEMLITVSSQTEPSRKISDMQPHASSRIWCGQLLLSPLNAPLEGSENSIDDAKQFHFPLFSAARQKGTFMTLLKILENSSSRIIVPVLAEKTSVWTRFCAALGLTHEPVFSSLFYEELRDEVAEELLSWSRLAENHGLSFSTYPFADDHAVDENSWLVSDPWNQHVLVKALQESPTVLTPQEWYKVNVVQKLSEFQTGNSLNVAPRAAEYESLVSSG